MDLAGFAFPNSIEKPLVRLIEHADTFVLAATAELERIAKTRATADALLAELRTELAALKSRRERLFGP